jgi:hypothetical protein
MLLAMARCFQAHQVRLEAVAIQVVLAAQAVAQQLLEHMGVAEEGAVLAL